MTGFVQLAVLGVATGSLYALSAMGIIVVFRTSGVINLANGGFAMVSGYTFFALSAQLGLPASVAVGAGIAVAALLGLTVYVVAIRPLEAASGLARIVATLAVFIVLQSVMQIIFGPVNKVPESFLPTAPVRVLGVAIGTDRLIIIGIVIGLAALLWVFYRFTIMGLATTAVSENPRALAALGRGVESLRAVSWTLAGALAGVAGVLIAPITQLTPTMLLGFLVPSLAAAIMGGMRSFPIALLSGMVLGAVQVLTSRYVPIPGASDALPFVVIVIVLVVFGRSLPLRNFVNERLPRVGSGRVAWVPVTLATLVIVALSYTVFNSNMVAGVTTLAATAIIAISQIVVTGYAGQVSLAQMSMAGLGGLVAAHVSVAFGAPLIVCLLVGVVVVIPVGILVGLPAMRTRGTTLAIATLGFGVALGALVLGNTVLNGGVLGLSVGSQDFFGISLDGFLAPANYMVFALFWLISIGVMAANLRRGRAGRRLLAVRTNERAASALGINVGVAKLYAFTLSSAFAAVGGVLLLFMNYTVLTTSGFGVLPSITTMAFAVLGGIGYLGGALIAATFNTGSLPTVLLSGLFDAFDIQGVLNIVFPLVGGLALLIQIVLQPGGIVDAAIHGGKKKRVGTAGAPTRFETVMRIGAFGELREAQRAASALDEARTTARNYRGSTLIVSDITVKYGTMCAVDSVSFSVSPGEVLSIIGPNGAGKTSIMDAITGFAPMSGTVHLGEQSIGRWAPHRRARAGLVRSFQTLELLEDMTVFDNLRAAGDAQDFRSYLIDLVRPNRGRVTAATAAAIDAFGLEHVLGRVPADLPYGDRHLVAIARAVAAEPSVLLLDEPAAGLSAHEREQVATLIRRIADEWKIAVLLIEHDVELVRAVSDRVVALDFGRSIATGTPDEVLRHPSVVTAYLGEPLTEGAQA